MGYPMPVIYARKAGRHAISSGTRRQPVHHGEEPESGSGSTMLGKSLIVGIVVPATCGIFGWEVKDHHAPRERLEPVGGEMLIIA